MATAVLQDHDHEGRVARLGICTVCTAAAVKAEAIVEESVAIQHDLFGVLDGQVGLVLELLRDGRWHTLRQMAGQLGIPEQSVSARIRDLRKVEFGSHVVEKRAVGPGRKQEFQYRLA